MKIVVGLGNPGDKYEGTRHNVGFDVLAELGRRWGAGKPKVRFEAEVAEIACGTEKLLLVAPQTFMNLSGRSVQQFIRFFQAELTDVLVVCDDLNLKVGQLRLRASGSAGGQKGLQSILTCLGSEVVPRLRLGIGRPPANIDASDYVLSRFRKDELEQTDGAIVRAASAVDVWAKDGISVAMNQFNADAEGGPETTAPS
ncbi:MAG: aminoacyl-tRNA hydrolase [Candidatus Saccharimonas sp.]|nr:aminoacyl-tRNA hydrolase [Planctomycetaceae bacterium]